MSLIDFTGAANAATAVPNPTNAFATGAEQGLNLGQQQAAISALQGVNLNDPSSIDNAIQGSIRAGSQGLQNANALLGLNIQQNLYNKVLPAVMSRYGVMSDPSSQPQQLPTAPPGTPDAPGQQGAVAATQGLSPDQIQQHSAMMNDGAYAMQTLAKISDPTERQDVYQNVIRPQFVARGIPAAAVDNEVGDLTSPNAVQHLNDMATYYQQHGQFMARGGDLSHIGTALGGGQPAPAPVGPGAAAPGPTPPQPPGTYNGYDMAMKALGDPMLNNPVVQAGMARLGFDMNPYLNRMATMAVPGIREQAAATYAAPKAFGTEMGTAQAQILTQPVLNQIKAQGAGLVTTAEEAAKAPWSFTEFKGPDNQPVWVRNDAAAQYAGQHGGVMAQGMGTAAQSTAAAQGTQTAELIKPDPKAQADAVDSQANAERALSVIAAHKFDNLTPYKDQVANVLRTAGLGNLAGSANYANDIAGYKQVTTQALAAGTHAVFPARTTNTDLKLMNNVFPSLTTPNDAAATAMGMQAATAVRAQDWEAFKANQGAQYQAPQALYKAWLDGPGGQSIFQSREWAQVPIGGRPAFNPATDVKVVNGQKIGAWGIGTGHPVYFEVH